MKSWHVFVLSMKLFFLFHGGNRIRQSGATLQGPVGILADVPFAVNPEHFLFCSAGGDHAAGRQRQPARLPQRHPRRDH